MFTVFIRAIVLYALIVVVMRAMGKRQIGQLQPFELAIAILIADLASVPMASTNVPLFYGVFPILALVLCHSIITLVSMKSEKFRALVCGKPTALISDGHIDITEMKRLCYNLSDLLEELREHGVQSPANVASAILETTGKLSIFQTADSMPVTPADLQLPTKRAGHPLTLITDGHVHEKNLARIGHNLAWLQKQLDQMKIARTQDVLLCLLETTGRMYAQEKKEEALAQTLDIVLPQNMRWS